MQLQFERAGSIKGADASERAGSFDHHLVLNFRPEHGTVDLGLPDPDRRPIVRLTMKRVSRADD
jgi:hypothetical protein